MQKASLQAASRLTSPAVRSHTTSVAYVEAFIADWKSFSLGQKYGRPVPVRGPVLHGLRPANWFPSSAYHKT